MSLYPSDPRPISPYPFRTNRPTVGGGPEWAPQDRALTRFGLGEADVSYRGKSWAQIMTLYNFFESVHGAAGRFTFADFNGVGPLGGGTDPGVPWSGLFVAKADGITLTWDLPTYSLASGPAPVVYENGSVKTSAIYTGTPSRTTPYNIKLGAGTDGVDQVTAGASLTTVAPTAPGLAGTSIAVPTGMGAAFLATPFYATVWPTAVAPSALNAEIILVNTRVSDILTVVVRAQRGTVARNIIVGDQIAVAPDPTVVITIDGTCRRAFRRAKFLQTKNPFVLNVPANYYQGPVTILEVRR
jgi:hypothetical protein